MEPLFRTDETPDVARHTALAALAKLRPQLLTLLQIPVHLKSRISVEDVLQEVARTILRTTLRADYQGEEWSKVIFAIAFRQLGKQVRQCKSELPPMNWTPVQSTSDPKWFVDFFDSVNACTPRQKRIVEYRLGGFSYREIAEKEGICEASVRRIYAAATDFLEDEDD